MTLTVEEILKYPSAKTAVLSDEGIEIVTDKEESVKLEVDKIESVKEDLGKNIKKLICKKFNEEHVPFWDAVKSSVKELELSDFNFSENEKYVEVVKNLNALDKATIELDIYCIGFLEGISLSCKELVLKGEAFDQIENGDDLKIKLPSVKNLTIIGRYVGWGPTDMSLESIIKNLKAICPDFEQLQLYIDDDNVDTEVPSTFIDLVSKPKIDENLNLKVVFNFTLNESTWQKSNFHKELKNHPNIELTGTKDGSSSRIKIDEKKLIEFNLSSEMSEDGDDADEGENGDGDATKEAEEEGAEEKEDDGEEAEDDEEEGDEPAAKKKKA